MMGIQRAVLKGLIAGAVQTRTIFTADVTIVPGDDYPDYWDVYIDQMMDQVTGILSDVWVAYEVEISTPTSTGWAPVATWAKTNHGAVSGDYHPNAVASVLLGKASGARHVGRKFFSAVAESMTTANALTAGAALYMADALLYYISPVVTILGSVLQPGVVDKYGGFHPFVGGLVSSLLGSMRRRKPGLGI
jgi:hypothetical protein